MRVTYFMLSLVNKYSFHKRYSSSKRMAYLQNILLDKQNRGQFVYVTSPSSRACQVGMFIMCVLCKGKLLHKSTYWSSCIIVRISKQHLTRLMGTNYLLISSWFYAPFQLIIEKTVKAHSWTLQAKGCVSELTMNLVWLTRRTRAIYG